MGGEELALIRLGVFGQLSGERVGGSGMESAGEAHVVQEGVDCG